MPRTRRRIDFRVERLAGGLRSSNDLDVIPSGWLELRTTWPCPLPRSVRHMALRLIAEMFRTDGRRGAWAEERCNQLRGNPEQLPCDHESGNDRDDNYAADIEEEEEFKHR